LGINLVPSLEGTFPFPIFDWEGISAFFRRHFEGLLALMANVLGGSFMGEGAGREPSFEDLDGKQSWVNA
jgi:hypothetical protein